MINSYSTIISAHWFYLLVWCAKQPQELLGAIHKNKQI